MILVAPARAGALNQAEFFHIRPEPLRRALIALGRQANLQVIMRDTSEGNVQSTGVVGRYTVQQAITILLKGSDLVYAASGNTLEFFPRANQGVHAVPTAGRPSPYKAEQSENSKQPAAVEKRSESRRRTKARPPSLAEVIVTGTHISGGPPPSEPIITITQRQIRESGYQSVEQLMDSLPENFNSVGSEQNGFQSGTDAGNVGYGAAADLMGLGYGSTLVLVNGHRLAPAGINGAFTDISVIPLSAVKRVDILTDGASAIYGADAIGGVVNYVLRTRQRGGETSLEYGGVTHGNLKDYRVSQSYGWNWSSGHALASYEYHDASPLNSLDRPFSVAAAPGDLIPGMTQNSVYLTANQSLGTRWTVDAEGFYSHRRNTETVANGTQPLSGYAESSQYVYALASTLRLPNSWALHARVSTGGNDTRESSIYGALAGDDKLETASTTANGPLYTVAAGIIKGAVGLQVRYEALSSLFTGLYALTDINKHRTVESAFVETQVPLLASARRNARNPALVLDIAGRVDRYSDFGTSLNPRAGIAYRPLPGLKIRSTVSTSFKAPNFYQLYGGQDSELVNSPEPQLPPGQSVALVYLYGSNPNLTAETSTEWTAGIDFVPRALRGLTTEVTYYHVRFKNRITDLGIPLLAALDQPSEYAPYIEYNPSVAQLQSWATPEHGYFNLTEYPGLGPVRSLLDAVAIADDRFQNVGQTRTSGLIANIDYARQHDGLHFHVGFNGTYLFEFKNIAVPGAAPYSALNTLDNPVNFRGRVTAGMNSRSWALTTFLNYVNHYRDISTGTPVAVASWTTINLTGSYRLRRILGAWGRPRISISCLNCLDRAPPAVRLIGDYLGYDPANASALGRFVTATITVRW
jgi:outer membrane cobalamin receptor